MRFPFVIAVLMAFALAAYADSGFKSREDATRFLTYYYLNPQPDRVVETIRFLSNQKLFDNPNTLAPAIGFLAGALHRHPERAAKWAEELGTLEKDHVGVVVLALWYADLPDSRKLAQAVAARRQLNVPQLQRGAPVPITDIPLEQGPWVLDALWGYFMATGEEAPVVRIAGALPWVDSKGDANRLLIGGAARWSLTSNARQHAKVMQICQAQIRKQPKPVAAKLRELVAQARKEAKRP